MNLLLITVVLLSSFIGLHCQPKSAPPRLRSDRERNWDEIDEFDGTYIFN